MKNHYYQLNYHATLLNLFVRYALAPDGERQQKNRVV